MTVAPPKAVPQPAPTGKSKKPAHPPKTRRGLLIDDSIALNTVVNERIESEQHRRLLSVVIAQTVGIAVLIGMLVFLGPFFQPIWRYYAVNPAGSVMPLVGLTVPNMTNRAILSWTINSVTEIMTIGFGDFETRLLREKRRFTPDGWDSFVSAFNKQSIGEIFKHNQLVLTTVPSDTPVILSQGKNEEDIYQWKVQVPVIMTYTTNNNITQRDHTVITLTIVRVPTAHNPDGIAIKTWHVQV